MIMVFNQRFKYIKVIGLRENKNIHINKYNERIKIKGRSKNKMFIIFRICHQRR